ncbi:MAG: hypothetical protein AB8G99_19545 [Planctomycetaceae bacterium]
MMKFLWTTPTLIFSGVILVISAALCFWSWQRSGFSKGMGALELLRLLLITMALATLNQPEWTEETKPEQRPKIAVLYDESGSMATKDVIDPEAPSAAPNTRANVIKPLLAEEAWKTVDERMDVVVESFSSNLPKPPEATDIDAALEKMLEEHPTLRGIVLMSDGDWNIGNSPSAAATKLRTRKIPVYSLGVGAESKLPDVEMVSVDAPTSGVPAKTIRIPFVISSAMARDVDTTVTLSVAEVNEDGNEVATGAPKSQPASIPAMGRLRDTIEWRPKKVGNYKLTLTVPETQGELLKDNNEQTVPIKISEEALKVLIVESFPRWEFRYIRNALERDPGVEVNCLMFHPNLASRGGGRGYLKEFPTDEELFKYDVVFLGDVGATTNQLTVENCEQIRQLVRSHAGGLVFLPGFRGHQMTLLETKLEELYPVQMDPAQPKGWGSPRPSQFELTESGRRSLLTRLSGQDDENVRIWSTLPGFHWYAAALRAKAGSETLATHRTETSRFGRVPLIVAKTSGTGKIVFMGSDGAWRWREGVEDLYHYRFWGQVVRWMAYQRNISEAEGGNMRFYPTPERPSVGDVVTLNVNVMTDSGEPLQNGTVLVQIESPSGQTDTVRLAPAGEDMWGLFNGTFEPKEGGEYLFVTKCRETGATLNTRLSVQGLAREKIGQPARYDVLDEIARITRGRNASIHDVNDIMKEVAELPEPEPIVSRVRIWSHPLWGGAIVLLLGIFWTGRKLVGVV